MKFKNMKKIVVRCFMGLVVSILLNSCSRCEDSYLTNDQKILLPNVGTKMVYQYEEKYDTITFGKWENTMEYHPGMFNVCSKSKFEHIVQNVYHSDSVVKNEFQINIYYLNASKSNDKYEFIFGTSGFDQTIQYANRTFNDVRVYVNSKNSCDSVSNYDKTLSYKYSRSAGLLELTICDSNKTKTLSRVF
jgi:hypothetical protein